MTIKMMNVKNTISNEATNPMKLPRTIKITPNPNIISQKAFLTSFIQ